MKIFPSDPRLTWQGTVCVEHSSESSRPWRLPYWDIELFPGKMLQERAEMPAGVRLSFVSNAASISGEVFPYGGDVSPIDLCCDGAVIGSAPLNMKNRFEFDNLTEGKKLIELWLPQFGRFALKSLELPDNALIERCVDNRPRWITYGSSITQCRNSASPTLTWPSIVAREANLDLTNLGFNGECHLDSMVARVVRDLPADFFSMCVGVNIHGKGTLNERSLTAAINGFVKIVREKHPQIPIVILSPIYSRGREDEINSAGLSYRMMRRIIGDSVAALKRCGDPDIAHVNGLDLFNEKDDSLLQDDAHPSSKGTVVLGHRFVEVVWPLVRDRVIRHTSSRFDRDYLAKTATVVVGDDARG